MKRTLAAIAAVFAVSASAPALAQGWYAGLSGGRTEAKIPESNLDLARGGIDRKDWSFGAKLGYDFTPHFGAEVAYYDLGRYGFGGEDAAGRPLNGEAKVRSFNVAAVGTLPFSETFSGYGKLGWSRTEIENSDNSEMLYGAGLKWMVDRSWGLYFEWNRYHDTKLDNLMLGALVRF